MWPRVGLYHPQSQFLHLQGGHVGTHPLSSSSLGLPWGLLQVDVAATLQALGHLVFTACRLVLGLVHFSCSTFPLFMFLNKRTFPLECTRMSLLKSRVQLLVELMTF